MPEVGDHLVTTSGRGPADELRFFLAENKFRSGNGIVTAEAIAAIAAIAGGRLTSGKVGVNRS
jgi:hypothetical protein